MPTLLTRRGVVLYKEEVLEGVPEIPDPSVDAVLVEQPLRITMGPNVIDTTEVTPSLDAFDPIVGGMSATIEFDVYLKGSGLSNIAPEWGEMIQACGFVQVNTGAPIAVEPLAAGGTTTTAVLGVTATTTLQTYRGRVIVFSGTNAFTSTIWDYSGVGKIASLTDTSPLALDATTSYTLPRGFIYRPTSTAIPSGTIWVYLDGLLYQFAGCRGTCPLTITSGGPGRMSFRFQGMFTSKTDTAMPAATYDSTRPPIWKAGAFTINSREAAGRTFSLDPGNNLVHPDNPNATESFDPAVITSRQVSGSIDPKEVLVATRDILGNFRSQTKRPLEVRFGTALSNRIAITVPSAMYLNQTPTDVNGYQAVEVPFRATGQDSGYSILVW